MTNIRVDPDSLEDASDQINDLANQLEALSQEISQVAASAPSYDGQFGPKVGSMAAEGESYLGSLSDQAEALGAILEAKSEEFRAADLQSLSGFARLQRSLQEWLEEALALGPLAELARFLGPLGLVSGTSIETSSEIPGWLRRILDSVPADAKYSSDVTGLEGSETSTPSPTPIPLPAPSAMTPAATSTPMPETVIGLPLQPIYFGGLTEAELAGLQQDQGQTNDCGEYSIAHALNLMFGANVQGIDVAEAADKEWFPIPAWGTRLWPGGPTTPQQQANIVNGIASQGDFAFHADAVKVSQERLTQVLADPDKAVIVTLGWDGSNVPQIARNVDRGSAAGASGPINGHAMLLVSYDPTHVDWGGNPAPWGFANSWTDGGAELYWIPDDDFERAFEHNIPVVGSNNAVIISVGDEEIVETAVTGEPIPQPRPNPTPQAKDTPTPQPTSTPEPDSSGS